MLRYCMQYKDNITFDNIVDIQIKLVLLQWQVYLGSEAFLTFKLLCTLYIQRYQQAWHTKSECPVNFIYFRTEHLWAIILIMYIITPDIEHATQYCAFNTNTIQIIRKIFKHYLKYDWKYGFFVFAHKINTP